MPSIQPAGASAKINMLLYADIGTGKTSLIGTGGKDYKILIMRPPTDHVDPIVGSGVDEMVVKNWEDVFEALDYMDHEGFKTYDWFAMDSISLLQDIGLDDVYEGALDRKGPPGSAERKYREAFGPDKGEYRVNMDRVGRWVRRAVSAGEFHLLITAHTFFWDSEFGGTDQLMPWIQGKQMPAKICGMMNAVGYMHLETVTRRGVEREARVIEWNKTDGYYAKCQFKDPATGESVFPEGRTINPTFPGIVEAMSKGRAVQPRGTRGGGGSATPTRRGKRPAKRS